MWENIGTLHNAVADYRENEHRLIKRCQVMADFVFSEEFRSTALDLHGSLPKSPPRLKKDTKEPRFIDEMPMTLPEQPECWGEGRPIQQKPGSSRPRNYDTLTTTSGNAHFRRQLVSD